MKQIISIFIFIFVIINLHSSTLEENNPSLYLENINSSVHASLGGMGFSDDVGQMYYNSAVLYDSVIGRNFTFNYLTAPTALDEHSFFLGYSWPGENLKYALGMTYLGNYEMSSYDSSGNFQKNFNTTELLFGFSPYYRLTPWFAFGGTLKFFYLSYYEKSVINLSTDFGAYFSFFNKIDLSLTIDNLISSTYKFSSIEEKLPVILKVNPSLKFLKGRGRILYQFAYSVPLFQKDSSYEQLAGIEFDVYKKYLQVRGAWNGNDFSFGLGSHVQQYRVSFAFLMADLENRISATLSFDIDTGGAGPFARPKFLASSDLEEELVKFQEGMKKYTQSNFKGAYEDFKRVVELNPNHRLAKIYKKRALLHLKTSNWLDQEQKKLIKLHKELARKYENEKNYGEAISEWRKVIELNPVDEESSPNIDRIKRIVLSKVIKFYKAGLNFYKVNDKLKAIESFSNALALNPEYKPAEDWLVKIKNELSKSELAERRKIESLHKAEVFYTRGLRYYRKLSYEEAIKEFKHALQMNSKHEKAKSFLAKAKLALKYEKMGLKGKTASKAEFDKGMKLYLAEDYYNAKESFERALIAFPANEEAREMIPKAEKKLAEKVRPFLQEGIQFYKQKKFSTARLRFKGVLELDKQNLKAEKYLKKITDEMQAGIDYNFTEGSKAFIRKNYSKAIDHLFEVIKLEKERNSSNKEAEKMLAQARKIVESDIQSIKKSALAKFNNKQYEAAIIDLEKILKKDPANAWAQKYLNEANIKKDNKRYKKIAEEWLFEANKWFENRDFDKSSIYVKRVLEKFPKNKKALELKSKIKKAKIYEQNQDKIASLIIKGVREYKRRNYLKAIDYWQNVKQIDPENNLVKRYINQAKEAEKNKKIIDFIHGQKYYKAGKYIAAREALKRALKENPGNRKARTLLRDTRDRIEEEKISYLKKAKQDFIHMNYEDSALAYMKAYRLVDDNNVDEKNEIAEKRQNALNAKKYYETGMTYFNSENNIGLSLDYFFRVLELNPEDKKAEEKLKIAKEKGQSQISGWMEQAKEAFENKKYKKAYSLYKSVTMIDSANQEAEEYKIRSLNKLKEIIEPIYKDGKEALDIKNYTLAIEKFNQVLKTINDYKDTKKLLSKARTSKARKIASRRKNTSSGRKSSGSSAKWNSVISRGIILYRKGKYSQAISIWKQVPRNSEVYSKARRYIKRAKLKM